jgi:hypothetical protein
MKEMTMTTIIATIMTFTTMTMNHSKKANIPFTTLLSGM